jgi:hypothetical protein
MFNATARTSRMADRSSNSGHRHRILRAIPKTFDQRIYREPSRPRQRRISSIAAHPEGMSKLSHGFYRALLPPSHSGSEAPGGLAGATQGGAGQHCWCMRSRCSPRPRRAFTARRESRPCARSRAWLDFLSPQKPRWRPMRPRIRLYRICLARRTWWANVLGKH